MMSFYSRRRLVRMSRIRVEGKSKRFLKEEHDRKGVEEV
jgi:hypothetical protein